MRLLNEKNEGKAESPPSYGSIFKYLGIGFDIIIFAIVGWIVAKSLGWNEVLGAGVGAIVGTIIMYIHLFWTVKRLTKKTTGEKNV
ncbi:MAG: hypothetical protein OdinLCB4_006140 [Candidatus Odinarchaeum yellowstonii]|uniref:AtpZ/AtpI family protein n=1 Tax=Odinarchaeota yellowstonii (strain LCB_4) TaxID=1841599 RepID=A0AAF0D1P4_ODILC|nr:MAG: hypothetical protein OdinLCB4_006140 [Candidatus Odinarchaeum yellowstonii]